MYSSFGITPSAEDHTWLSGPYYAESILTTRFAACFNGAATETQLRQFEAYMRRLIAEDKPWLK
jgi:hypothetical protein